MLFNSLEFLLFLPLVFALYWFVFKKSLKVQNLLIIVASYVFYGWWDWRFLFLIAFSTALDFYVGQQIYKFVDDGTQPGDKARPRGVGKTGNRANHKAHSDAKIQPDGNAQFGGITHPNGKNSPEAQPPHDGQANPEDHSALLDNTAEPDIAQPDNTAQPDEQAQRDRKRKAKLWLWVSVICNVGLLGFFKYYNFFVDSFVDAFAAAGYQIKSVWTLRIILPVGISFYTFQTMSYSFDIYYKKLKPTRNFVSFAAFVAFFPQLVAGPIERASNLLGQINSRRIFTYAQASSGLKLILWGFFKKLVIADSLAPIVDDIFANYADYPASTLVLGVCLFSFQVYGDFSGYTDIAIGTAKLFGIELMSNFKFPNFSRNMAEYWQRWHVSLSTWFRHYIYIPLGGSRVSKLKSVRNICVIFLVSGLWHGANWTFVFWGGLHALLYIPVFLMGRNRLYADNVIAENSWFPSPVEILQVLLTFSLVTFSRIFFRSPSIADAFDFIDRIASDMSYAPYVHPMGYRMLDFFVLLGVFTFYEFLIRKDERHPFKFKYRPVRLLLYVLVVLSILLFYDDGVNRSFIYFQF